MTQEIASESTRQRLADLASYRHNYLSGDEKGEAQVFCDKLFRAFGHEGIYEAGASLEYRIAKLSDKGKSFADLMYKPHCLIEMKRANTDLSKHFRQAFSYWERAVPDRPRYVILCNFDEFWIYDFNNQIEEPVDRVSINNLPERAEALAFLFPEPIEPIFNNDLVAVTREAASDVASVFLALNERGVEREVAQRFALQCVMAMFSEDIGLLPNHLFTRALQDSATGAQAYDLLGNLFREMNTVGVTAGGRFKGTPYFNGGLFSNVQPIELDSTELDLLHRAVVTDWSAVRPEIFGTLFEQSMDAGERHAYGAHFTSQADIAKIVRPTIVDPWREQIEAAATIQDLEFILQGLYSYRVLDPACGSGNFLYVAYRELRRLENDVIELIRTRRRSEQLKSQARISWVSPANFYGIDRNQFAVEIAKVTLLLATKLAADELDENAVILPLDNLDDSIVAADALFHEWPQVDVVVGNPPFLGRRKMVRELGAEYCDRLAAAYPEIGGVSDHVCYWFPKTHDHLADGGRAGLVGTKSITQGSGRRVSLDYVVDHGGSITEAVQLQPWSGTAAVYVSIANWVKNPPSPPEECVLWVDEGQRRLAVSSINSSLSPDIDLRHARNLGCNVKPKRVFQGQTPGVTDGFELTPRDASILKRNEVAPTFIHPFIGGSGLLNLSRPESFVADVDTKDADVAWARNTDLMHHLEQTVLPVRKQAVERELAENAERRAASTVPKRLSTPRQDMMKSWWMLWRRREEMVNTIDSLDRYIAVTRTAPLSRLPVFQFVDSSIRLGDTGVAFAFDDDYSLGILQSSLHVLWFRKRCTALKVDPNYTLTTIFRTFPWPQSPSESAVAAVVNAAAELVDYRAHKVGEGQTMASMYEVLRKPGQGTLSQLHAKLDAAVIDAYGFDGETDPLVQLLDLNYLVAEKETAREPVTCPGPIGQGCVKSTARFSMD